jgi:hypothetical protein
VVGAEEQQEEVADLVEQEAKELIFRVEVLEEIVLVLHLLIMATQPVKNHRFHVSWTNW